MLPVTPGTAEAASEVGRNVVKGKVIDKVSGGRLWDAGASALGVGSDHESVPLWKRQKISKQYWLDNAGSAYDAYLLNKESGIGDETSIMRRLRKAGLIDADGNVIAPEGYDPSGFDPTSDAAYNSSNRNRLSRALKGPDSRPSLMKKAFEEKRAELAKTKLDDFKKSTIDPLTKTITQRIQEMLNNPAVTPEDMANMRSEAVSQARAQEAQRLTRVGATLGLRGIDPGSIAGAALISKIGDDTDRQITDGLRQFGLDVAELNQSSNMQELGLSTGLTTQMAQLETALTSGNLDQVFQITNDIAAMQEAIAARDEATKLQKEANRNNLYGSVIGGASNIVGGALSGNL